MRWTSAQRNTEITNLDQGAAAKLAGAADADQAATRTTDDLNRRQATATGQILRQQASDMRNLAQGLRDGYDPADLGYTA